MRPKRLVVTTIVIFMMLTGLILSAHANSFDHNIGGGIGLPYGGIGVNYELGINDWVAATAAVGWLPENIGWNLGVRGYYPGIHSVLRARLSLLYGTNAIHKRIDPSGTEYKTNAGFSAGIGLEWRINYHWGLCGDVFFADTDTPAGYEEKDGDIFASLGFKYHF